MSDLGDQIASYNGEDMKIRDIPDEFVRQMLGYGHIGWQGRTVVRAPGLTPATTPDKCTNGPYGWTWVTVGGVQYLVCPMCGLDGT